VSGRVPTCFLSPPSGGGRTEERAGGEQREEGSDINWLALILNTQVRVTQVRGP